MKIDKQGVYYIGTTLDGEQTLGMCSENLGDCLIKVRKDSIVSVFGSPHFGFHERDLDFLSEIPFAERCEFWDVNLKSISGLYICKDLKILMISGKRPPIEFGKLCNLQQLTIQYCAADRDLEKLHMLKEFYLWKFNKPTKFFDLAIPDRIEIFGLNWSNIESLNGLQLNRRLVNLEISHCRNLIDISAIEKVYPNLKKLVIKNCKRLVVGDVEIMLGGLRNLKHAYVNNRLLVGRIREKKQVKITRNYLKND